MVDLKIDISMGSLRDEEKVKNRDK